MTDSGSISWPPSTTGNGLSVLTALQEQIGALILEGINVEVPSVEMDLFETGVLDSMAFVELLLRLEEAFGIQISIEELEVDRFRSIERIAHFVAKQAGLDGTSSASEMGG